MDPSHLFPFEVGQEAESKSFQKGYRGAWFRCKIHKLIQSKDQIKALLEFYDYPGEKMHMTKLYQKPSKNPIGSTYEGAAQLILRPSFPPLYRENQMPDPSIISDLIVIVNDVWKVGDLVDWWSDGCYWSGEVTHLLGEDKVKVKLPNPPEGEGNSYDALSNDLRPSLDWSLEHGWTVPENEASCCCARLVWPQTNDMRGNEDRKMASSHRSVASCKIQSRVSSAYLAASLLPQKDDKLDNYEPLAYGITESCEPRVSVPSSTLGSRLMSSTGGIDPPVNGIPDGGKEMKDHSTPTGSTDCCVNEASMFCSSREDSEMGMEAHSTKISLDLDNDLKNIACGLDEEPYPIPASSCPLEAFEISKADIGREKKRERVCSTSTDSDDYRRETTSVFRASQRGAGKEAMEVTGCGSEIQPPIKNSLDLNTAGKDAIGRVPKSSATLGALSFPGECHSPETNATSPRKLVTGNTEKEVQSMNTTVDAEDGKRATTNSLDMVSESHEDVIPSNKDEHGFRKFPEGLRITENHHPSEADALVSSVLELEEFANKIKWLRDLIIHLQWSNEREPTWKISES